MRCGYGIIRSTRLLSRNIKRLNYVADNHYIAYLTDSFIDRHYDKVTDDVTSANSLLTFRQLWNVRKQSYPENIYWHSPRWFLQWLCHLGHSKKLFTGRVCLTSIVEAIRADWQGPFFWNKTARIQYTFDAHQYRANKKRRFLFGSIHTACRFYYCRRLLRTSHCPYCRFPSFDVSWNVWKWTGNTVP